MTPTETRPTEVSLQLNGPQVWRLAAAEGETAPNLTLTIRTGVDVLTYWLCQTCLTLQTRLGGISPVRCADCCDVEGAQ